MKASARRKYQHHFHVLLWGEGNSDPWWRHGKGSLRLVTGGRCMTARDRLRAWDAKFFGSSNLTHKSCGIFVASWGFAHCIGTRLVFHNFFYLNVKRTNGAMQKTHKVLKMHLLIFTLAAFIRGSLEPQRLLIQIWRSSVTDACKQSHKS